MGTKARLTKAAATSKADLEKELSNQAYAKKREEDLKERQNERNLHRGVTHDALEREKVKLEERAKKQHEKALASQKKVDDLLDRMIESGVQGYDRFETSLSAVFMASNAFAHMVNDTYQPHAVPFKVFNWARRSTKLGRDELWDSLQDMIADAPGALGFNRPGGLDIDELLPEEVLLDENFSLLNMIKVTGNTPEDLDNPNGTVIVEKFSAEKVSDAGKPVIAQMDALLNACVELILEQNNYKKRDNHSYWKVDPENGESLGEVLTDGALKNMFDGLRPKDLLTFYQKACAKRDADPGAAYGFTAPEPAASAGTPSASSASDDDDDLASTANHTPFRVGGR